MESGEDGGGGGGGADRERGEDGGDSGGKAVPGSSAVDEVMEGLGEREKRAGRGKKGKLEDEEEGVGERGGPLWVGEEIWCPPLEVKVENG